ncbi:MAG: F0F1 ATP synthase subunit A, partial [Armatimonadetes bacterium]|nr:F0F1 ATP synthase subunit A [Armatimonadota bacterium]
RTMHEPVTPFLELVVEHLPEGVQGWVDVGVLHAALAILVLTVAAYLGTRRLADPPEASKLQMVWEWVYEALSNYFTNIIGPKGPEFVPLLGTFFVYIFFMNLMILLPGFSSPTARLGVTAALGVIAFFAVQYYGFRYQGIKYLKHFIGEPLWLAPLNIIIHTIGELARPLSLSVRLFGNIFGEDTMVMQFLVLSTLVFSYIYIPVPFQVLMLAFAIFGGFVQALVFSTLTAAYIAGAIEEEH